MRKRLLLLVVLYLLVLKLSAQSTGFMHYGVEDGLPQSQVTTIAQDKKGRLWVGTMAGAARFNGKSFQIFSVKQGLAEAWITSSLIDRKGNIWFGHWAGGISVVKEDGSSVIKLSLPGGDLKKKINDLCQSSDSVIWIATEGEGIVKLNINRNTSQQFHNCGELVKDISIDGRTIWVASEKGLYSFDEAKGPAQVKQSVSSSVSCVEAAMSKVFATNKEIKGINDNKLFDVEGLSSLFTDSKGRLWAASAGNGVLMINGCNEPEPQLTFYNESSGLNFNKVNVVFEDQSKNIWIGTDLGLNLFSGGRIKLFGKTEGLSESLVWSVLVDKNGTVWSGTSNGLFILKAGGSQFQRVQSIQGDPFVTALHEAESGEVLVGTRSSGLFIFKAEKLVRSLDASSGFPLENIHAISDDVNGNIWIGTEHGAGMIAPDGKVSWFTEEAGLGGNYVSAIECASDGHMWFAIAGGALTSYKNGSFRRYGKEDGLGNSSAICLAEDRVGNIWVGAYGDGLYFFDGNKFRNIPLADGTNSDTPLSIAVDDKNRIWLGTNRGIDKFDPVTRIFEHYGKQKGFTGVETNLNAVSADKAGNLWFGTLLGAAKVDTRDELLSEREPVVTLDGIRIHHEAADFPSENNFSPEQEHITFLFSAVDLRDPDKIRYQYYLEGFDREWSVVTSSGEAVYANLPPGQYKFFVKAGTADGKWTKTPLEYSFTVQPPYYRTWWFNMMLIVGVVGGLLGLLELRTRKLRKSKKDLELQVRERTLELGQKNMELARKNKELTDALKTRDVVSKK